MKRLLGFYDYTVILTYLGTLIALHGILALMGGQFRHAVLCLMGSGFCDMFDGTIAATKQRSRQEKRFGIQIDSLNDLIAFGVLPALIVYHMLPAHMLAAPVACLYVLCALIRLAYFNVMEEERQEHCTERREEYEGLPVTTAALALPAVYAFYSQWPWLPYGTFTMLLVVMGALFISPVRIRKPQIFGKISMVIIGALLLLEMLLEV